MQPMRAQRLDSEPDAFPDATSELEGNKMHLSLE